MNDCARLSDRIPDVARQGGEWNPEEAAHLARCAECRMEWELVLAARALAERTPGLSDPSAVSATLLRRLAENRAGRARIRRAWSFAGAAAAAAAILVAVMSGRDATTVGAPQVVFEAEALVPLPELEGLEAAQLDTLLQSIDRPFAGSSTLDASTLGEHEEGELEQVFASWEG